VTVFDGVGTGFPANVGPGRQDGELLQHMEVGVEEYQEIQILWKRVHPIKFGFWRGGR
jgi:hypothetical protein